MVGKSRVLIIGGQFSGNFSARELKKRFHVTVVETKEFFEYTPGVLRLCETGSSGRVDLQPSASAREKDGCEIHRERSEEPRRKGEDGHHKAHCF